jgi:threonine dehydrogenase-like Zn-dependent dehydrogenase
VYTRADFEATVRWIDAGEVDLDPMIEARVDLPGLVEGVSRATPTAPCAP